jgi:hypothetical protein
MTFTTAAFDRSSSWRFEASSYKATSKGPPPSLVQHDACGQKSPPFKGISGVIESGTRSDSVFDHEGKLVSSALAISTDHGLKGVGDDRDDLEAAPSPRNRPNSLLPSAFAWAARERLLGARDLVERRAERPHQRGRVACEQEVRTLCGAAAPATIRLEIRCGLRAQTTRCPTSRLPAAASFSKQSLRRRFSFARRRTWSRRRALSNERKRRLFSHATKPIAQP